MAAEGRSVSGTPFITSYYFPLSRAAAAAAAAAVNIPFHRPVFALVFLLSHRIQLAFKRRRLWQGVNPARGIPLLAHKAFTSGKRVPVSLSSSP